MKGHSRVHTTTQLGLRGEDTWWATNQAHGTLTWTNRVNQSRRPFGSARGCNSSAVVQTIWPAVRTDAYHLMMIMGGLVVLLIWCIHNPLELSGSRSRGVKRSTAGWGHRASGYVAMALLLATSIEAHDDRLGVEPTSVQAWMYACVAGLAVSVVALCRSDTKDLHTTLDRVRGGLQHTLGVLCGILLKTIWILQEGFKLPPMTERNVNAHIRQRPYRNFQPVTFVPGAQRCGEATVVPPSGSGSDESDN